MTRITAQLGSQLGGLTLGGRRRPPTLVAVAHGSRDPEALRTVTALVDRVRALRPDRRRCARSPRSWTVSAHSAPT
ncbi:hypothetical protein AB4Z54_16485, partial [Streptomyces sp. MCAF7]